MVLLHMCWSFKILIPETQNRRNFYGKNNLK